MYFGIIMPFSNVPKTNAINHKEGLGFVADSLVVLELRSIKLEEIKRNVC